MWLEDLIRQLGLEDHRSSDSDVEPSISKLPIFLEKSLVFKLL